jgi:hypothetical protein
MTVFFILLVAMLHSVAGAACGGACYCPNVDDYEPNNVYTSATPVVINTVNFGATMCLLDQTVDSKYDSVDWYTFTANFTGFAEFWIQFSDVLFFFFFS